RGARRRSPRGLREGALDATAAGGVAAPRRRRLRGGTCGWRARRFAWPGLRGLRRGRGTGARPRRRLHQERDGGCGHGARARNAERHFDWPLDGPLGGDGYARLIWPAWGPTSITAALR